MFFIRCGSIKCAVLIVWVAHCISGCSSYYVDFDAKLTASVGRLKKDVLYPPLDGLLTKRYEGNTLVAEYALNVLGRCRWEFVIEVDSGKILSWRYPDKKAETGCHQIPQSMT